MFSTGRIKQCQGFVLLIVLSVLGILAFLAIQIHSSSRLSHLVSGHHLHSTKATLAARSGYEFAVLETTRNGQSVNLSDHVVTLDQSADNTWVVDCVVSSNSVDGRININDGMAAGRLEIGDDYNPKALDPRPRKYGSTYVSTDISGMVNLRLRRLLNAYGDVHLALNDHGPSYRTENGLNARFSSSAVGQKSDPMPPFNFSTGATFDSVDEIPFQASGLGDRIIASRPIGGFKSVGEIRDVVLGWASDWNLMDEGPQGDFFERIKHDMTIDSYVDMAVSRLKSEIYSYRYGNSQLATDVTSWPPNFKDNWAPHAVAPININAASFEVLAALFYAPVNVSYIGQGFFEDGTDVDTHAVPPYSNSWTYPRAGRLGLAVGEISREDVHRLMENGLPQGQANRYMSLKDAMQAADNIIEGRQESDWPRMHVCEQNLFYKQSMPNEKRAEDRIEIGTYHIVGTYLNHDLHHVLSPLRRMPSFFDAPAAMCSLPYVGSRTSNNKFLSTNKTIEDYVQKMQHPKITFRSSGLYEFHIHGRARTRSEIYKKSIRVKVKLFDVKTYRSQKDFEDITDVVQTSPEVLIGPEWRAPKEWSGLSLPEPRSPHAHFGFVGLRDHVDPPAPDWSPQIVMNFDVGFDAGWQGTPWESMFSGEGDLNPNNPNFDPTVGDPGLLVDIVDDPPVVYPAPNSLYDASVYSALMTPPTVAEEGRTWRHFDAIWTVSQFQSKSRWRGHRPNPADYGYASEDDIPLEIWIWHWVVSRAAYPPADQQELPMFRFHPEFESPDRGGIPRAAGTGAGAPDPIRGHLRDSQMESTGTLFDAGPRSIDLSPFGGARFYDFGHGSKAVKGNRAVDSDRFNDTLYWNLSALIDSSFPLASSLTEGTATFWFRIPATFGAKTQQNLMTLNLWEWIEIDETHTTDTGGGGMLEEHKSVKRPVVLRVDFVRDVESIAGSVEARLEQIAVEFPSSSETVADAGSNEPLALTPFSATNHYGLAAPGAATGWKVNVDSRVVSRVSLFDDAFVDDEVLDIGDSSEGVALTLPQRYAYPGAWVPVLFSWNTNEGHPKISLTVANKKGEYYSSGSETSMVPAGPFGDYPSFNISHDGVSTLVVGESWHVADDELLPIHRLNSSVDNLRVGFGKAYKDFEELYGVPEYIHRRYDIRPDDDPDGLNEPEWVVDPGFKVGTRIIGFDVEIFDPKVSASNPQKIDLSIDGVATVANSRHQKSLLCDGFWQPNARARVKWTSRRHSGHTFNGNSDIPYLLEISFRYQDGPPQVISWEEIESR